jgi:magnesium transporter
MRVFWFADQNIEKIESPNWTELLARKDGVLWVDLAGPTIDDIKVMRDVFHFHPLAIEDTSNQRQRPKIEEYRDHLFIILNPIGEFKETLDFRELDVFVTRTAIVTVHSADHEPIVDQVMNRCTAKIESAQKVTVGFLIYALADSVVDLYFPLLDQIGDEIEMISESVIETPRREDLNRAFRLKRALAEMWRVAGQQRDMFNVFQRQESPYINEEISRYYMRDVYDHLLRINDTVSTFRDTMSGAVDLYLSAVSNRLSIVVKRLTFVTIGIGVLTVISGFYGMNFEKTWPPFNAEWGVPFVLLLMLLGLVAVGIAAWRSE